MIFVSFCLNQERLSHGDLLIGDLARLRKVNFIINFLFSSEKKAQQKGSRKHKAHKNENRSARTLLTRATSEPV